MSPTKNLLILFKLTWEVIAHQSWFMSLLLLFPPIFLEVCLFRHLFLRKVSIDLILIVILYIILWYIVSSWHSSSSWISFSWHSYSLSHLIYQTAHFLTGFMLDPWGQLNESENSWILLMGPMTLNMGGEWDPTITRNFSTSFRYFPHQTLAAEIQKSWSGLYSNPGKDFSASWSWTHFL